MTYHELTEKHSKELNAFPMKFAFSNEQMEKAIAELGVKKEEMKEKLLAIPGGGMIRKSDGKAFTEMFDRHNKELADAQKDDEFLIKAIEYELGNHEYIITYDPEDTIECLSLDMADKRTAECFKIARGNYLRWQEEHGCFA